MRRTKEEAAATRTMLLQAALVVFSEKGYAATRLEDVAEQAKVTRGAIYWHFKNKADLYNTLLLEYGRQAETLIIEAINEGGTVATVLRRMLVRLFEYLEQDDDFRAVNELALFKTELLPELAEGWQLKVDGIRQTIAQLTEAMREGIAAGELRADLDPQVAAQAFMAYSTGVTTTWLSDPAAFSLKAQAPALADMFLRGIVAEA
ncbi:MAG: TetR family transcriptional regulator [Chloroflexaceae bacterium]|nr:TetR family transcriptional regulator [Chloroflexaceae bacterium]